MVTWGDEPSLTYKYASPNKLFEYISEGMYILSFSNYSIEKWNKKFGFGYVSENCENDVDNLLLKIVEISKNKRLIKMKYEHNLKLYINSLNFEYQLLGLIDDLNKIRCV
ncbi:hypothetical protein [Aliarcobacter cryaerophilus]|uniref:hypothetical protein n=1 Tax=Aliarcobacter cryaerophilus TaxID=28198 RepID=UPI0021B653C1|nr:hypothetical protein [Aliarcobacter cryaerophilus]MCT7541253.1 hypothetical protein [Aliarcobacter cryaerophilus]